MIREDVENLNYKELSPLEQQEYINIVVNNLRRVVLQLVNSGHTHLASVISISTSLASLAPAKLADLMQYTVKLSDTTLLEIKTAEKLLEQDEAAKTNEAESINFPPLDSEKEN